VQKKNLRIEEVGDELILWEDEPLQAHVLDRVQTRIYRLVGQGKSVGEIETALREAFRVPPEHDLKPMIQSYLFQFLSQGLIEEPPGYVPPEPPES
jgi:hypothetical protein